MATTSIADKLAKLEKKIAKRQATIAEEQTQLDKELAEYDKLYLTALANKYKLSGKDLFSAIEREHKQLEKLREGEQSDDDADSASVMKHRPLLSIIQFALSTGFLLFVLGFLPTIYQPYRR